MEATLAAKVITTIMRDQGRGVTEIAALCFSPNHLVNSPVDYVETAGVFGAK